MRFLWIVLFLGILSCAPHQRVFKRKIKPPEEGSMMFRSRWVAPRFLVDQAEISNRSYREFLHWMGRVDPAKHDKMLPDTNVWVELGDELQRLRKYYLRHPNYYDHPVVGISMEQAIEFCKWRSRMLNIHLYYDETGQLLSFWDTTTVVPEYLRCRLPTREEWTFLAKSGLDTASYRLGVKSLTDKRGKPILFTREHTNLLRTTIGFEKTLGLINCPTLPVEAGVKNSYQIYNLVGNVSEMTSDSLVMGLNHTTYLDGAPLFPAPYSVSSSIPYEKPGVWLGFRCVIDVLEENWPPK